MVGNIRVHYIQKIEKSGSMLFLPEEQKLLDAIADRLSHFLFSRRLKNTLEYMESPGASLPKAKNCSVINPMSTGDGGTVWPGSWPAISIWNISE